MLFTLYYKHLSPVRCMGHRTGAKRTREEIRVTDRRIENREGYVKAIDRELQVLRGER